MEIERQSSPLIDRIKQEGNRCFALRQEVGKVIVGQEDIVTFIIIALLCKGHILLEGVPGVAKTTMIKVLTETLGLHFKRIQFTPDLLPADLIGTLIYNPKTQEFETKKGPIFAHLILADEINRAPAKVQAALLEAMQEHQVTIGSQTYKLDQPFLVFATQNPIEQEGTYQLPEAQVDRFTFKLIISYPTIEQEREIIRKNNISSAINQIMTKEELLSQQQLLNEIYVDNKIIEYISHIVFSTRAPERYGLAELKNYISYGVSPRASINLYNASRAHAFIKGRHFVTPDDVKAVAQYVLCHRIPITYEGEARNITSSMIVQTILNTVTAP